MDWSNQKLGDYCEVIAGQSPEGKYYNDSGEGLPFYQGKKEFGDRFLGSPKKWTSKVTKEAKAGDILMSVRAPVGPINFSTQDICIGRGLAAIRSSDKLDKDFLFYYLLSKQDEIQGSEGAVFASINKVQIEALSFSYVEIKEQKRIVAILDQAFADIEQARAKTEQNLKNARELFESYLLQVFSQRDEGWVEIPLGSVCNFQNGYAFKSKDTVESSNTQLIRMGNLYQNVLDLNRKSVFYPDKFSDEYEQFKLNEGDMIISLTGTVGKEDYGYTVEIPATDKNLLLNQRIAKIIDVDNKKLVQRFLLRILRSRVFLDELYSTANGTRQANLSTATMKEIMIAIPRVDKQVELCREFDSLEAETMKLAKIYSKKLVDLDELKKSILQKAFSGELTKTPDNETNKGAAA